MTCQQSVSSLSLIQLAINSQAQSSNTVEPGASSRTRAMYATAKYTRSQQEHGRTSLDVAAGGSQTISAPKAADALMGLCFEVTLLGVQSGTGTNSYSAVRANPTDGANDGAYRAKVGQGTVAGGILAANNGVTAMGANAAGYATWAPLAHMAFVQRVQEVVGTAVFNTWDRETNAILAMLYAHKNIRVAALDDHFDRDQTQSEARIDHNKYDRTYSVPQLASMFYCKPLLQAAATASPYTLCIQYAPLDELVQVSVATVALLRGTAPNLNEVVTRANAFGQCFARWQSIYFRSAEQANLFNLNWPNTLYPIYQTTIRSQVSSGTATASVRPTHLGWATAVAVRRQLFAAVNDHFNFRSIRSRGPAARGFRYCGSGQQSHTITTADSTCLKHDAGCSVAYPEVLFNNVGGDFEGHFCVKDVQGIIPSTKLDEVSIEADVDPALNGETVALIVVHCQLQPFNYSRHSLASQFLA